MSRVLVAQTCKVPADTLFLVPQLTHGRHLGNHDTSESVGDTVVDVERQSKAMTK